MEQESQHRQAIELLAWVVAMLTMLCRRPVAVVVNDQVNDDDQVNDHGTVRLPF